MKQPDTAALRERLANYTPENELEQDKQELDGLLQEVNYQLIEFRNLLKEINALKEELHDIHGSLKHTVQRERTAFNALLAAKDSADNIGMASTMPFSKRNSTPLFMLRSAPKNWRKCINVPPTISKPKRNYWRNIVKN